MSFTFGEFDTAAFGVIATLRDLPSLAGLQLDTLEAPGADGLILGGASLSKAQYVFDVIIQGTTVGDAHRQRDEITLALDPKRGERWLSFDAAPGWRWRSIVSTTIDWKRLTWDAGAGFQLRADITFDVLEAHGRAVQDDTWEGVSSPWVETRRNLILAPVPQIGAALGAVGRPWLLNRPTNGTLTVPTTDGRVLYTATAASGYQEGVSPRVTSLTSGNYWGARIRVKAGGTLVGRTSTAIVHNGATIAATAVKYTGLWQEVLIPATTLAGSTGVGGIFVYIPAQDGGETLELEEPILEKVSGVGQAAGPFFSGGSVSTQSERYRWAAGANASESIYETRTPAPETVTRTLGNASSFPTVELLGDLTAAQTVAVTIGPVTVTVSGPLLVGETLRLDWDTFDFARWVGSVKVASVVRQMSTLDRPELWPGEPAPFTVTSTGTVTRARLLANSRRQ